MKQFQSLINTILVMVILACTSCGLPNESNKKQAGMWSNTPAKKQPNVVIIFADDMGYGDLGCYGAKGYETASLDKMANEGMLFTDFSVSNPICTPSRAALLTSRYPQRWGYDSGVFGPHKITGLPESEITIAEILKTQGYRTAIVGKWHLGHLPQFLPTNQGFDYYFGIPYSNDSFQDGDMPLADNAKLLKGMNLKDYKALRTSTTSKIELKKKYHDDVPLMEGEEVIEWPVDQSQLTKRYTEKAIEYIHKNAKEPFFLYLAHSMPHTPLHVSKQFKGKTERGLYGDVMEEVDWSIGQILQTLKDENLAENTLVIFTSDNGPWLVKKENSGSAGDLRGGKATIYEGGQRVPFIAWWPETIPNGIVCNQHITAFDILPTIARFTNANVPNDRIIDGFDISNILKGKINKTPKRKFIIYSNAGFNDYAIRVGDWKYRKGIKNDIPNKKYATETQLFNLKDDPNERNNLANKYPDKLQELALLLESEFEKLK